jgi:hypothetical protein
MVFSISNKNNKPVVLFLCTPNLGILDSWLPVLRVLKDISPNVNFIFLASMENFMNQVNLDSEIIKKSEGIFNLIVFRSDSGLLLSAETFTKAKKLNADSRISIFHYGRRLMRKLKLNSLYNIFYLTYEFFIKNIFRDSIFNINLLKNFRYVTLLDVSELIKPYSSDLYSMVIGSQNYSLGHGAGLHGVEDYSTNHIKKSCQKINTKNTTAYLYSETEIPFYKDYFQLESGQIKVYGVPKHDNQWVKNFKSKKSQHKNKYIFIISRTTSEHYLEERRFEFLEMIKKIAIKFKLSVVVKLHPIELDISMYKKIFESGVDNVSWEVSTNHPYSLGNNCEFAICFGSSVPLDLLHLGIPSIELSNLKGIKDDDHKFSLRDCSGEPVRKYRYLNLVLGASSYNELEKHVVDILKNKQEVVKKLKYNYTKSYSVTRDINIIIANEIKNNLIKLN